MFPIGDDKDESGKLPFVVWALIAANIAVFLLEAQRGEPFILQWSFIPAEFTANPAAEAATLVSAMFLHGGVAHLAGNMLYLWIFGDNIEGRYGPLRFALFYIVCGLAATFSQYALNPGASIPNLGASGAIAGVLGAYVLLYPNAHVKMVIGSRLAFVPAWIALGLWFAMQIGLGAVAFYDKGSGAEGGIAYAAHAGGFAAGFLIAALTGGLRRYIPGA
jgi:membrane associated rhomboid family serine protease